MNCGTLGENIETRIDRCLLEGNTPSRIILRGDDLRRMAGQPPFVEVKRFWGVPIVALEHKEVIAVWGLVIARSEDVEALEEACARRRLAWQFVGIDREGCFLLAQQGMGRAG